MLVACWSAKGGVGTTVVAAALALVHSRTSPSGAVLADLSGDAPAVLGVGEQSERGLVDWLGAGPSVPADALARLELEVRPGLALLPRGDGHLSCSADRAQVLAAILAGDPRPVVADCGRLNGDGRGDDAVLTLAAGATHSLLVTRACYLGLRRAASAPLRPSGVVLLNEPGRALGRADVEQVVGAPVRAEIAVDPAIARAVDAGVLGTRLPRRLERALRYAA